MAPGLGAVKGTFGVPGGSLWGSCERVWSSVEV